jgi:hypothetical protein
MPEGGSKVGWRTGNSGNRGIGKSGNWGSGKSMNWEVSKSTPASRQAGINKSINKVAP